MHYSENEVRQAFERWWNKTFPPLKRKQGKAIKRADEFIRALDEWIMKCRN